MNLLLREIKYFIDENIFTNKAFEQEWYITEVILFVPNNCQLTWRMIMTKFITLSFLVCTGHIRTHQTTEFNESISCNSQRLNFHTILLWSFFKVFLNNNLLIVFKQHLCEWINVIDYCVQLIPVCQPFGAPLTGILLLFSLAAPFETSQQPKAGRPTVPLVLTNVLICTSLNLIYQVNQWTMKGGGSIRVFWKQRLLGQQRRCAQTYICAAFRPQP